MVRKKKKILNTGYNRGARKIADTKARSKEKERKKAPSQSCTTSICAVHTDTAFMPGTRLRRAVVGRPDVGDSRVGTKSAGNGSGNLCQTQLEKRGFVLVIG